MRILQYQNSRALAGVTLEQRGGLALRIPNLERQRYCTGHDACPEVPQSDSLWVQYAADSVRNRKRGGNFFQSERGHTIFPR